VTAPTTTSRPSVAASAPHQGFRPDIEGLRAIAVVSVLIYHAGLAWTPGGYVGVDVFFVISGFLITSLMVREVDRSGRLNLAAFWARRARRLLPASALVLVFSGVVALLWLPVTSRKEFGGDIVAAACYVVNWRLGAREVDYLAENVGASPVQHYWSLAVEEQFYIVWPLLIVALVTLFRARWRLALLVGVGTLTAASFVYTLSFAVEQPGLAFFYSTTRIWELGLGALLAIGFPTLVRLLPTAVRGALGWVGLAMIGYAVLTLDSHTVWPGTATLLPVLGTAAAILSGGGDDRGGAWGSHRLLGLTPMVWIGGLSYSLYLWHWPFLIAAQGIWGHLQVRYGLLVVLASVIPAWLSYRYVENPLRTAPRLARPRPALLAGALTTAISAVAGLGLAASFAFVDTVPVASAAEAPGARALDDPQHADTDWAAVEKVDKLRPSPLRAYSDTPEIYQTECVVGRDERDFQACTYGVKNADKTIVLVGDSKAAQWFTPLNRIAESQGWRFVVILKNGCSFADVVRLVSGHRNPSCEAWGPRALEAVKRIRPEVVVTVTRWGSALPEGSSPGDPFTQDAMVDGLVTYWNDVIGSGATLVPILDTPGPPGSDAPGCVQGNLEHLTECVYSKRAQLKKSGSAAQVAAAAHVPDAHVIDMSPVLCPDGRQCPSVIGKVLVYRSGSHLSNTYASTATTALSRELSAATGGTLGKP
jgi:peptidoglycan/LPS O-acetylase OafA/YrhL